MGEAGGLFEDPPVPEVLPPASGAEAEHLKEGEFLWEMCLLVSWLMALDGLHLGLSLCACR